MQTRASGASFQATTLVDLARERARQMPDLRVYTFLDREGGETSLTTLELDRRARAIATELAPLGRGARVLLLFPPGVDYIIAFFGCLYAGVVAVPVYPPRNDRSVHRLQAIARDVQAAAGLVRSQDLEALRFFLPLAPALEDLRWIATDAVDEGRAEGWTPPPMRGEDLAFLQYTSGSTGLPKGVMLRHQNLLHNLAVIERSFGHSASSRGVIWLPPYHDMGLIGGVLQPLYAAFPVVLMSPMDFLEKPIRWLEAITRYRATTSGGPDFAYDLCVRKTRPEERRHLDLSSWRVAFNGAETIRARTLQRFTEAFAPCGFRHEAFFPCYGLAEATLIVTGSEIERPPLVTAFDRAALERGRAVAVDEPGHEASTRQLVSSGAKVLDGALVIVDPECRSLRREGEVGEIWVAGSSVAAGYWNQPEASEATFCALFHESGTETRDAESHSLLPEGPFLRTGDLGFLIRGQLFVTGRAKDLIIIRGLNHYPQDIERTVERSHPALRPGAGAAFSIDAEGAEALVIVYEMARSHEGDDPRPIFEAIQQRVAEEHELRVHAIALVAPGTIPKTSSGKIQRYVCREAFLADQLELLARFRAGEDEGFERPASTEELATSPLAIEVEKALREVLEIDRSADPRRGLGTALLGLDSLTTVELQHQLQRRLKLRVPLTRLLQSATLAQLVAEVERAREQADAPLADIARKDETGDFELSYGQRALWFLHALSPRSSAYHIVAALRVLDPLDIESLRRALLRLVARHPALRTTFHAQEGKARQRVHAMGDLDFQVEDADGADDQAIYSRLCDEAEKPFDLERGPLLRLRVLRQGPAGHVLLVVVHHLVADFWSLAQLANELSGAYLTETQRRGGELSPIHLRYTDYVAWQSTELGGDSGKRLWAYWRQKLAGPPPLLERLADRPRPPVQTYRGARCARVLEAALAASLQAFAREQRVTLFATLLAAYGTLLFRHNGQPEIWIGAPTAGRERAEFAEVVGYFVNPVVLRIGLSGDLRFTTLLAQVDQTVQEALEHADMPFALLVEQLWQQRDASRSPLFQTMFTLQRAPGRQEPGLSALALGVGGVRFSLAGLRAASIALAPRASAFDLSLSVAEVEGRLHAVLEYNEALFEPASAARLLQRFESLLRAALATPEATLSSFPLDSAEHRAELLAWAKPRELPQPTSIHRLFEAQARRTPDAPAIVSESGQLSYRELDQKADAFAQRLCEAGVSTGELVGLYVERSIEQIVALLGILKAGAAYVPLDPEFSTVRLSFVLKDARIRVLVIRNEHAPLVASLDVRCVAPGDLALLPADSPRQSPRAPSLPEDLAYVIYTSGSTGQPKGVMISHRAVSSFIRSASARYGIRAEDRLLQFNSLSFDASVEEIFNTLTTGATMVLRTASMLDSMRAFLEGCRRWGVTVIDLPTAFWHALATALDEEDLELPPSIRLVLVGGERIRPDRLACWHRRVSEAVRLVNVYGPTEGTVVATCHDLHSSELGHFEQVPIGRPLSTMGAYVLDGQLEPVPMGAVGELWLAGEGLARAYLDDPALSAQRFLPNPYGTEPGSRLYRTGDLARVREGGVIEYVGRVDDQVKIRGFRVELGEVEEALRTCPGVREALALMDPGPAGEARLVGYVAAPPALPLARLREHLAARLPSYMMPAALVRLEAFPLSSSGKIDRAALPTPVPGAPEGEDETAPQSAIERALAQIWSNLLHAAPIGVHRDFFELGGHSLLAMQMMARVRDRFGVELPVRALFEHPTIAGLATQIEGAGASPKLAPVPPLLPVEQAGPIPLSFAQHRLWVQSRLERQSLAYHVPGTLRLSGPLDVPALEQSLAAMIARHASLRTSFVVPETDADPVQNIEPTVDFSLARSDLSALPAREREARARELTRTLLERAFDLGRAPLLRAQLLRLDDEEHQLTLVMHHLVCDGWSLDILLRELTTLYAAARAGQKAVLPPLALRYADFAIWERRVLDGEALATQLAYWQRTLEGAPSGIALPMAHGGRFTEPGPCARVRRALPAETTAALRTLSQHEGVSLFIAVLAAFKALLHRYTGEHDLVVGTSVAHRTHTELEGLVGFFANMLVLRTELSGSLSFRALLARLRDVVLGALAHQDLPFERLVEALNPTRSSAYPPFLQLMFVFQNAPSASNAIEGLAIEVIEETPAAAKCDLLLEATTREGELHLVWEYDAARFEAGTIERMAEHYRIFLDAALARPDASLGDLPLLSAAEELRIASVNATRRAQPEALSIVDLFAAEVDRRPEAIAVEQGASTLSYQELDQRANRLAHHLRRRGVGPELLVGVLLDRSIDMVASVMAILKAGGAYLPLDPTHPPDRLAFLIRDAQVRLVLTRSTLAPLLEGAGCERLCLDTEWPKLREESAVRPPRIAWDQALAYVIYTSGSTGRPKGVMVPHRALANYLHWCTDAYRMREGRGVPVHSSLAVDLTITSLLAPLLTGKTLVLVPESEHVEGLVRVLRTRSDWSLIKLTPSHLHLLSRELGAAELDGLARTLILGGEALPAEALALFRHHARGTRIINEYGPTEAVVGCCIHEVSSEDPGIGAVPIGQPIANTQLHVLDARMLPVPPGLPGELYIAGECLGRGYRARPALTAARFVPDPFGREPGARMYRTGDLVRWRADGRLEFLGRVDFELKLRGHRIDPGEVEAVLLTHPEVRQALVLAVGDRLETKRLVAHVTLHRPSTTTALALRRFLLERLPAPIVPSAIALHAALPLLTSGKVDRHALAALPIPSASDEASLAPRTELEALLAAIWSELLERPYVGVDEDFLELGGNSLLAMQVVSRLREATNIQVTLAMLFESRTIARLSEAMQAARASALSTSRPLLPVPRTEALPLSFSQQRLWFATELDPESPAYNIPGVLRLRGALDAAMLEQCVNALLERHEVLRTAFVAQAGQPVQIIAPRVRLTIPLDDLRALPPNEREARARELEKLEAARTFDLREPPLLRARLLRLDAEEHLLLVTLHHIVADGWSIGVMFREVAALYEASKTGKPPELSPLSIQYADFAYWQRRWLSGDLFETHLQYWRERLAGAPPELRLPFDRPRPELLSHRGSCVIRRLDAALTEQIKELGGKESATLFMVVLSAFYVLLHRLTSAEDIVVGTPIANRTHPEIEGLIGFFVNTLALRCEVKEHLTFQDLLRRVRGLTLEAYDHQEVPFDRVVDELGIERSLRHGTLIQVLFVLQNVPLPAFELSDLTLSQLEPNFDSVKFDVVVILEEREGGVSVAWNYSTDLFDEASIARMHQQYERVLAQVVVAPNLRIGRIALKSAFEQEEQSRAESALKARDFARLRSIQPKPVTRPPGDAEEP